MKSGGLFMKRKKLLIIVSILVAIALAGTGF